MSLIPGSGIGAREKILAMPSVGVLSKTHVHIFKCLDWASGKKELSHFRDSFVYH